MHPGDILDLIYKPETHYARFSFILDKVEEANDTIEGMLFVAFSFFFLFSPRLLPLALFKEMANVCKGKEEQEQHATTKQNGKMTESTDKMTDDTTTQTEQMEVEKEEDEQMEVDEKKEEGKPPPPKIPAFKDYLIMSLPDLSTSGSSENSEKSAPAAHPAFRAQTVRNDAATIMTTGTPPALLASGHNLLARWSDRSVRLSFLGPSRFTVECSLCKPRENDVHLFNCVHGWSTLLAAFKV